MIVNYLGGGVTGSLLVLTLDSCGSAYVIPGPFCWTPRSAGSSNKVQHHNYCMELWSRRNSFLYEFWSPHNFLYEFRSPHNYFSYEFWSPQNYFWYAFWPPHNFLYAFWSPHINFVDMNFFHLIVIIISYVSPHNYAHLLSSIYPHHPNHCYSGWRKTLMKKNSSVQSQIIFQHCIA